MNKFLLGSFALFGFILIGSSVASADSKDARKAIDNVLMKLAFHEQGEDLSELTMEELEAAYKEYNKWPPSLKETIQSQEPMVQLLHDFLMVPMESFRQQVGHQENDPLIRKGFAERLQVNYERFKPLYFGHRNSNFYIRSPKTDALVISAFGLENAPALSGKMVQAAKSEYMALKAKAQEIVEYEDIYASLNELENIMNYLNRNQVKMLADEVFPLFTSVKSFNDELANQMKKACAKALRKMNLIVQDGQLKTIVYVDEHGNPIEN